jgi:hypothetical protein
MVCVWCLACTSYTGDIIYITPTEILERLRGVFQAADLGGYKHLTAYSQMWLTHVLKILLHTTDLLI